MEMLHFYYSAFAMQISISAERDACSFSDLSYCTSVCNTHITADKFKIRNGKNESAKRYSKANTIAFPRNPAARSTQAALKNIFVVSQIRKCGFKRKNDPGTDLAAEIPIRKKITINKLD